MSQKEKIESVGKCFSCEELVTVSRIGTHLAKHLVEVQKKTTEPTKQFNHIVVTGEFQKEMFLQLLVDSKETLDLLDSFLRDIWLECCGHMSAFRNKYDEIEIDEKVGEVFLANDKISYLYDFGSSTYLKIKALKTYNLPYLDDDVILLSRNEPLKLICETCNDATAVVMCAICYGENGLLSFCKKCAKKHGKDCDDFADYAEVAIVNSPRCGECGYEGGQIDLERDGVYKTP